MINLGTRALYRRDYFALALPVLRKAGDPAFAAGLNAYKALPTASHVSLARKASVLEDMGDLVGALAANEQALALAPSDAIALNNQCYILARADRAREALSFCERAVQAAPDVGAIRHSQATALAKAGQCVAAQAALAEARRLDPTSQTYRQQIACTPQP